PTLYGPAVTAEVLRDRRRGAREARGISGRAQGGPGDAAAMGGGPRAATGRGSAAGGARVEGRRDEESRAASAGGVAGGRRAQRRGRRLGRALEAAQLVREHVAVRQLFPQEAFRFGGGRPAAEQLLVSLLQVLGQLVDDIVGPRGIERQAGQTAADLAPPLRHSPASRYASP